MVIAAACEAICDLVQTHRALAAKMGSTVIPSLLDFAHHKSGLAYQQPASSALNTVCEIAPCKLTISALLSIHGVKSDKHSMSREAALHGLAAIVRSMPEPPLVTCITDIMQATAKALGDKSAQPRAAAKELFIELHARFPDETNKGLDDAVRNRILDRKKATAMKELAEREA